MPGQQFTLKHLLDWAGRWEQLQFYIEHCLTEGTKAVQLKVELGLDGWMMEGDSLGSC